MSGATVLERELLGANSARPRHHHRHEDANLILQLGTVVTATLQDIDSPPSSECTITPPSRSQILARTHHENKERNNERHDQLNKCRSNNHILPYQFVLQDHNYGAPPPPTPPLSPAPPPPPPPCSSNIVRLPQAPPLTAQDLCGMAALATVADQVRTGSTTLSSLLLQAAEEDSRGSPLSSDEHDDPGLEGEETETAAEGEGDEDSVTRCICDFEHDDGYMICCDKCCVWQHVDCMGIDRTNIPDEYLCELCQPRRVDRTRARNLQMRKQMHNDTSSSDDDIPRHVPVPTQQRRLSNSTARKRPAKRETKKVVKRQRRDSAAVAAREQRVSERRANKKKESMIAAAANTPVKSETKRIGTRRRSKGKGESIDEETQDSWGNTNNGEVEPQRRPPQPLRQWIDSYEEAVTNHYSPELRARISNIKVNGVHSDFKVASSSVQRCRTSLQENGIKILISTQGLHANQPIIEVRGKYMLANQQSMRRGGGGGALSPSSSPYLLFYSLPKEGTEVCVDARTYGNDARFVRRACKPNAEVRHCIEKGTLHLYLVASGVVDKHSEITIKHEEGGVRFPCKDCPPHTPSPAPTRNGFVTQESVERGSERRRRGSRRSTISEESSTPTVIDPTPSPPVTAAPVTPTTTTTTTISTPVVTTPPPVVAPVVTPSPPAPPVPPSPPSPPAPTPAVVNTPVTRRAPKSPAKTTPVQSTTPTPTLVQQGEDSNDATSPQEDKETAADKRKMTREERKMEAIMKAFERLEKAEQRKQQQQHTKRGDREDSTSSRHSSRDDDEDHETTTRRKGRRTRGRSSSGASNQATSADESSGAPMLSPATPVCASPRALASPPPPPIPSPEKNPAVLLNNCLGFKFPKTKKGLMNEWLNKPSEAPASPVKLENNDDVIVSRTGSAAAKKRWLRQAISEECELPLPATPTCSSPNSRGGSPPCGDYVTPLKKRRLARASVSSEQSFTPPTTPASDKEGAHSPDLDEAPAVDSAESRPPAAQIINAARCVEEAVMVLSAGTDFLDKVMGEKKDGDCKSTDEVPAKEIKVEPEEAITPTVPVVAEVKPEVKESEVEEKTPVVPSAEDKKTVLDTVKSEPVQEIKEKKEDVLLPTTLALAPPPPPPPQEPCTPPPAITPPSAPSTPTMTEKPADITPASIKRKLSISEYRQRKQQKEEEKGEGSDDTTSLTSQDEERPSSASPSDTLLELSDIKTEGAVAVGGSYMRWSSEPTLVERQRENLTERLKREFGLFVDDQDPNKANKKATVIPGIAGIVPPTTGATTTLLNNTAVVNNDKLLLPELPPLVPPAIRSDSPHNIPLPPCAPLPIHDLLAEPPPPPPPPIEEKPPPFPPSSIKATLNSKSIPVVPVQNGPLMKIHGKSLISGGVQIKNQTPTTINNTTVSAGIVSNVKIPIPTSSTTSVSKSINNSSS